MQEIEINMKIMITGGTGSLGKALIKTIKKRFPKWEIIVFSRDEGKQALIFGQDRSIKRIIGDVRDYKKLNISMKFHKPDYVIHTAALKRIDDMELYPDECVKTNIKGTENVALASLNNKVKKCILISTDKACQPVNVYGSSKFIAERIFTNFDYNSSWGEGSTIFASVRYGNVIASRGSFIPLWLDLIAREEKFKVTSMDCSRFLFTLDDAVNTVLTTLEKAQGGEIFIPKIDSYSMSSVLEAMKTISNKKEIDFEISGLRPGEKIHEDMLAETELAFAYYATDDLLTILPQYTKRKHTYTKKYHGRHMNSSLYLSKDIDQLVNLIYRGLDESTGSTHCEDIELSVDFRNQVLREIEMINDTR
jgi:UDP-N-acetylglucosamine 4,6-dehydratase